VMDGGGNMAVFRIDMVAVAVGWAPCSCSGRFAARWLVPSCFVASVAG
jgi:hypothetical protein